MQVLPIMSSNRRQKPENINKGSQGQSLKALILAERQGFEPWERVNVHTISSRTP